MRGKFFINDMLNHEKTITHHKKVEPDRKNMGKKMVKAGH